MLADHAGIEQAHLARMDNGAVEPGIIVVEKVAAALDVPIVELFNGV
jgi:predicted transcriptional regulator